MTSRLVTVDLILSVSTRLPQWKPLPFTEQFSLYVMVREILNHWAKLIEEQELLVELETIAESAVDAYRNSDEPASWDRLVAIGDHLLEQVREIHISVLNRSAELIGVSIQAEIAKALTQGGPIKFTDAAKEITELRNPTEARNRFRKGLALVRDLHCSNPGSQALALLQRIINESADLTTAAVALFKTEPYFTLLNGFARKRRKAHNKA